MTPKNVAVRSRDSLARLKKSGGDRKAVRLTAAALAALATLKARHPQATQDALICQAIEALAAGDSSAAL